MSDDEPSEPRARVAGTLVGERPPWGAPDIDVAARGYVVEEYVLEG